MRRCSALQVWVRAEMGCLMLSSREKTTNFLRVPDVFLGYHDIPKLKGQGPFEGLSGGGGGGRDLWNALVTGSRGQET